MTASTIDLGTLIGDAESVAAGVTNPVSGMLAGVKIAGQALPLIFGVAQSVGAHLPQIQAAFSDLEAELTKAWNDAKHLDLDAAKADIGKAWADGMAIYDDVGLPRSLVQQTIAVATKDNSTPDFVKSAISVAESLAKQLGLPVPAAA